MVGRSGVASSTGPGRTYTQRQLRHLTCGRVQYESRTIMPLARGVAPVKHDPPETRRRDATKEEDGRAPRIAVGGGAAFGNSVCLGQAERRRYALGCRLSRT